jgi:hypothetical protein
MIAFTQLTTASGAPCGKRLELDESGELHKTSLAHNLSRATQERIDVADAAGFAAALDGLSPNQAFAFGVAADGFADVITRKAKAAGAEGITRTRDCFDWPDGPGILLGDYDPAPGAEPLNKGGLLDALYVLCPGLRDAAIVWRPSAGSCIYRPDGSVVRGVTGQRLYLPVVAASDIPRAAEVLHARAWLAGNGRYLLSRSGSLLDRGLLDATVWQPERLDFCGGADCRDGLYQKIPPAEVIGAGGLLDTRKALPDLSDEEKQRLDALKRNARAAIKPQQDKIRETYVQERAPELAERAGVDIEQARATLRQAVDGCSPISCCIRRRARASPWARCWTTPRSGTGARF